MPRLVLLTILTGVALGQFENLATVDDGSVVYFTTGLRPANSGHPPWPKIYRLIGGEFRLVAAPKESEGSVKTDGWLIGEASVSGDGRVLALNSRSPCHIGSICAESLLSGKVLCGFR